MLGGGGRERERETDERGALDRAREKERRSEYTNEYPVYSVMHFLSFATCPSSLCIVV